MADVPKTAGPVPAGPDGGGPQLAPPGAARWTDRRRLGLLLEGAEHLAELEASGRHLADGWTGARLTPSGRLAGPASADGPDRVFAQERLRDLVGILFGSRDEVAGRGRARRIVRELLEGWRQSLAPLPARRAVRQILDAAPFLGPAGRIDAPEGGAPLDRARALYGRGRFAAAVELLAGAGSGGESPEAEALTLRCRLLLGELDAVIRRLHALAGEPLPRAVVVDLAELAVRAAGNRHRPALARGWLERARAETGLDPAGPAAGADSSPDSDSGSGSGPGAAPTEAAAAAVVTAEAAWDRGDSETMLRALDEAASLVDVESHPRIAWRYHRTRGLAALSAGDGPATVEALGRALTADRRGLCRHEAAGLWNDLGMGRARLGDLAGAERAFLHTQRLLSGCDGGRQTTLALYNLAEIRLRRGRTLGVREILRQSTEENRLTHNVRGLLHDLALWARFELVRGRPDAALEHLDEAIGQAERREVAWHRAELRLLEARALGRLGEEREAAAALTEVPAETLGELEPEERPGLFALAGRPERALDEAEGTALEPLWRALLEGSGTPVTSLWDPLAALEPGRAARVVLDAETVCPGAAPAEERRRAAAAFRRIGASRYADALERVDSGPWRALAGYLTATPKDGIGDPAALRRMLEEAGYPEARIERWRESDPSPDILVGGPGGGEEIAANLPGRTGAAGVEGERLVLRARQVDPALRALFALALRDLCGGGGAGAGRSFGNGRRAGSSGRGAIVGESPALLAAMERLERLAPGELPVLLLGESGTGKELAARHLHRSSRRRESPFVAVNCAALSENLLLSDLFGHVRGAFTGADRDRAGVFETAHGGTVFLDEIGDLPPAAQGMLLRVLQEGEVRRVGETLPRTVDARLVTATHRSLREMVEQGSFRQDLYYRLCVGVVELPALRDRGRDPVLLAEHLLEAEGGGRRLTGAARARLLAHHWPGNVRELENVVRLATTLAGSAPIGPEHLELPEPGSPRSPASRRGGEIGDYHARVGAFRRRLVREAMEAAGGNKSEAARRLGLSRQALSYLTKEMRIV